MLSGCPRRAWNVKARHGSVILDREWGILRLADSLEAGVESPHTRYCAVIEGVPPRDRREEVFALGTDAARSSFS